jgi:hypothetical protein
LTPVSLGKGTGVLQMRVAYRRGKARAVCLA